jgi:hypothetical protein
MQLHSRADEQPTIVKVGENVFYYYGRGGGGVPYPDEYFYNLDGNILGISFDGAIPFTRQLANSPNESHGTEGS